MAIAYLCGCGVTMTVGDRFAGRRGRCKHCRRPVLIPGSSVFVPAAPVSPMARRGGRRVPAGAIVGGVILAIAGASGLILWRIEGADPDRASRIVSAAANVVGRLLWPYAPLVLPPILARFGKLSMARWLIMALFCASVFGVGMLVVIAGDVSAEIPGEARYNAGASIGATLGGFLLGVPGCILAAVLHRPKR